MYDMSYIIVSNGTEYTIASIAVVLLVICGIAYLLKRIGKKK